MRAKVSIEHQVRRSLKAPNHQHHLLYSLRSISQTFLFEGVLEREEKRHRAFALFRMEGCRDLWHGNRASFIEKKLYFKSQLVSGDRQFSTRLANGLAFVSN